MDSNGLIDFEIILDVNNFKITILWFKSIFFSNMVETSK